MYFRSRYIYPVSVYTPENNKKNTMNKIRFAPMSLRTFSNKITVQSFLETQWNTCVKSLNSPLALHLNKLKNLTHIPYAFNTNGLFLSPEQTLFIGTTIAFMHSLGLK